MSPSLVQLDDNEIKMLLVAIRQVQHTFTIAEQQSTAAVVGQFVCAIG